MKNKNKITEIKVMFTKHSVSCYNRVQNSAMLFRVILRRGGRLLCNALPRAAVTNPSAPQFVSSPLNNAGLLCSPIRDYSKDKNRKKENKKGGKVAINEDLLRTHVDYDKMTGQMEKALDDLNKQYIKNLSLRSTTGAIEQLPVNVDGTEHELQELGQIMRKNPKTIVVNMIAFPQTIPAVLVALSKSGMNLNPQQDGTTIFIPVPKVTKEHRENLSKNAKTLFLKCRDALKTISQDHIKKLKRPQAAAVGATATPAISSDEVHALQGQITAIADKYILQAEKTLEVKQQELNSAGGE